MYREGDYKGAEAVFQEWSNISRKPEFNFEINTTLDLAKGHGLSLYKQEKYDKAEAVYGKWLEISKNALGETHLRTLSLKKYLDQTLEKQKNTE